MSLREQIIILISIQFILPIFATKNDGSHFGIVQNLLNIGETELVIFGDKDFEISTTILGQISLDVPMKIFNIDDIWSRLSEEQQNLCPDWDDLEYVHEPF